VALVVTLAVIHFVPSRPFVVILLVTAWWGLFHPIEPIELILAGVAAAFFLVQNYVSLDAGLFEFKYKDVLLQPLYEPFLWGFYFLSMKRFVSGRASDHPALSGKAVAGLVATSIMFSIAGADSRVLLLATGCSTLLLLAMFHTVGDLAYATCALVLGLIVEIFGVSTGLWWYPSPDFLGIPFWFATMWVSVGLLGRRFLVPVAAWIAARTQRE